MGTKGLVGYIHRGQKFVRYVPFDSYASGLGTDLERMIPSDPEGFLRWLEETREMLEGLKFGNLVEDETQYTAELSRTTLDAKPSVFIEWTYVFDLDHLAFTNYIAVDGCRIKCLAPWTPDRFRADSIVHHPSPLSAQEREGLEYYNAMAMGSDSRITTIYPTAWNTTSQRLALCEKLALVAAEGFIAGTYADICRIQKPDFFKSRTMFEDLAKDLLMAACYDGSAFSLAERTARDWLNDRYEKLAYELRNRKRLNSFWFRGRLVVITRTLDDEEHFKSQVGLVLRKMEEEQRSECTVILWSIHHVAVVVVSGGNISHSDPVPVAAALRMDREKLVEGIKLIAHYLPPVVADESAIFVCRLPLELVLHVMEFLDAKTSAALGRTSKALRYEWLRRPRIDSYQLLAVQKDGFLATDDAGRYVDIKLAPFECLHYKNKETWEVTAAAWRKPNLYLANLSMPGDPYTTDRHIVTYLHGYRASVTLKPHE